MENVARKARVWQSLPVITLVALLLRLIAVRFLYTDTWNGFRDHLLFGFEIGRIARSIAAGRGYGNPMLVETGPTAWMTPVYPYLLAGVFKLFGIYSKNSALVILTINAVFSALICVPVFWIARRSFGPSVAVLACWMWALWPYAIYIAAGFVWETCLSALLLAVLFLCALKLKERAAGWRGWLGFGLLWGVSALTNASTLSVAPFLTLWALYPLWRNRRQEWLQAGALVALGLIAALLPWQVRNFRTFHRPIPLRDNFWLEVWVGNNGYTQSWVDIMAHPSINETEMAEFARLGEIPYMQEKRREALTSLSQHPEKFLVMFARRFVYMWTSFWNLDPYNLETEFHNPANVYLIVTLTMLMLIGLWKALRGAREAAIPFVMLLAFYPLVFYLTHPANRYRHMIEPEIVILAALGARFVAQELLRNFPSLQRPARQT
ncbi:MAG: glycosyltransferase family 39 protein [Candidatus Acidiferrales bacterium]